MSTQTRDVVIIGGGIIGLAIARELAGAGLSVALLERNVIGQEASWAAGGILTPVHPWSYPEPLSQLANASLAIYPELVAAVTEESGVDAGYRASGLASLVEDEADLDRARDEAGWLREHGTEAELIDGDTLQERTGLVNPRIRHALWMPEVAQVRNPRLCRALAIAAARRGATIHEQRAVDAFDLDGSRVTGVRSGSLRIFAGTVVLAAGAWSGSLSRMLPTDPLPVEPARGQIIVLQTPPIERPLEAIILADEHYAVPRPDGRLLVGSTVERVGFDKRVTVEALHHLTRRATDMVPALAGATFSTAYAGLRPATPDRLPYVGPIPGLQGLFAATGHFRNGILLAPITARLVTEALTGQTPSIDLAPLAPGRPLPE